jgi:predicted nucleotidyltransferase component of viral defense system
VSVTSQDLLQRAQERTGLARNQLLLMVAKSAAVRHIAQGPHSGHFVLKGGTLLTHVYSSPASRSRTPTISIVRPRR